MSAILEVRDVVRSFGGVRAVDGASLDVAEGSITSLIGPNGAGKSTLFNVVSGFLRPDAGRVVFEGRRIERKPAYRIAQAGLVRTFQTARALTRLTVLDNLLLAAPRQPGEQLLRNVISRGTVLRRELESRERAKELLALVRLERHADDLAGTLSGGQRKLLDVARALMAGPRLVLLDEPMAGVNPTLRVQLLEHIVALRDELGLTVLLVEHDLDVVMRASDRVVVMSSGVVIAEGTPAEVEGGPEGRRRVPGDGRVTAPLLEVEGLEAGYGDVLVLHGVGLRAERDEVVAIIGPNGAGKSTLLKAVYGLVRARAGSVRLAGEEIVGVRPDRLTRLGLNLVPQLDNVFPSLSIAENLKVSALAVPRAERAAALERVHDFFPLLRERPRQRAGTLSGGQRKLVALARALVTGPRLLLLDEPSAGLAPQAVGLVFEKLAEISALGIGIVMVEQNARRALALSHRGYVLDLGRNAYEGSGRSLLGDPKVAELYLGGLSRSASSSISTSTPDGMNRSTK